jgi:hypothetical protein
MSETSPPEQRAARSSPQLRIVALVAVVVAALAGVAIAVAVTGGDEPREARIVEIVVPNGTAARLAAGETIIVMPSRLELRVGDVLRIRNDDVVDQSVGPYFVAAGEQFELRYGEPGVYTGYCPLTVDQRYEIVVEA